MNKPIVDRVALRAEVVGKTSQMIADTMEEMAHNISHYQSTGDYLVRHLISARDRMKDLILVIDGVIKL